MIDTISRQPLIHESGHALACYLFYENTDISIEIFPYGGGDSLCGGTGPSDLGWKLGLKRYPIRMAAGYMAGSLWDYITLIIAQSLPDKYSELKTYLRLTVLYSVLRACIAAIAAEEGQNDSFGIRNDFFDIRDDFPPLAALAVISGSFLLLQAGMSSYSLWRSRRQNPIIGVVDENGVELSQTSLPSIDNRFALFNLSQISDERKEPLVTPRPH